MLTSFAFHASPGLTVRSELEQLIGNSSEVKELAGSITNSTWISATRAFRKRKEKVSSGIYSYNYRLTPNLLYLCPLIGEENLKSIGDVRDRWGRCERFDHVV